MQNLHTNPHPIEVVLLGVLVTIEALAVVVGAVVALLLTLAGWRPTPPPPAPTSLPEPCVHPLQQTTVAAVEALEPLTVAQLRRRARDAGLPRCLSRGGRRNALLAALTELEVVVYY